MGTGRREFLARFGAVLGTLSAGSSSVAAAIDDLYVNPLHGIALRKPQGWRFEDLDEQLRFQEGLLLDGVSPADWAHLLGTIPEHHPFVIVSDESRRLSLGGIDGPAEHEISIAAGVFFEGTWERDGPAPTQPPSLPAFVDFDLECFSRLYWEFTLLREPRRTTISGCESIEYTARFRWRHTAAPDGIPVRERVLYIYQKPAIFSVRMCDYPEVDPTLTQDYDEFVETIIVV